MNKGLQIFLSIVFLIIVGGLIYFTMQSNLKYEIKDTKQILNPKSEVNNNEIENTNMENQIIVFKTNQGDIKLEIFADKAPNTANNFITLVKEGFYNGTRFHRVIKDFMIQGGDPLTKDESQKMYWGTGGPGYKFEDEFGEGLSNVSGTISMANSGPNTNGSQFFINTADNTFLDGKHAVFGKVIEGMEIVTKIEETETDSGDRPLNDMIIESVSIVE